MVICPSNSCRINALSLSLSCKYLIYFLYTSQIFSLVLGIISFDSYFLSTAITTPSLTLMPIEEFPS